MAALQTKYLSVDSPKLKAVSKHKHLFEQIGIKNLVPDCMLTATDACKHSGACHSCAENVLSGFSVAFIKMLLLKLAANNLMYLGNPKKLIQNLLNPA